MEVVGTDEEGFARSIEILRNGGIIVYPTDTLYGLGSSIDKPQYIKRIFREKRMEPGPFSLVMAGYDMVTEYAEVSPPMKKFLENFPAGPFTLLLRIKDDKRDCIPDFLVHNERIGVRIPLHAFPRNLVSHIGPITSTSANIHGERPPVDFNDVVFPEADLYVNDGKCLFGQPSTILTENEGRFEIVREGALEMPVLQQYLGDNLGPR